LEFLTDKIKELAPEDLPKVWEKHMKQIDED
jgi:hypothetical protein